jgi:hypothetical protein
MNALQRTAGQGIAAQGIAAHCKAPQSNAANPSRGFVKSFWLKRTAPQFIAMKRESAQGIAGHRTAKQRGLSVTRISRVVLAQWHRMAIQRKAARCIAIQSNADCPLCGHSESFWLKSSARNRRATHCMANRRNSKQRGQSAQQQIVRVILAQMHGMERQSIARQRSAWQGAAEHGKATRVVRYADIPSRFGSRTGHRSAPQCKAAHINERRSSAVQGLAPHGIAPHRKATRSVHPVN